MNFYKLAKLTRHTLGGGGGGGGGGGVSHYSELPIVMKFLFIKLAFQNRNSIF